MSACLFSFLSRWTLMRLCLLCLAFLFNFPLQGQPSEHIPKIAISQIVEHPALDRVLQGILDALEESQFPHEQMYENAQGSLPTAAQISKKIASWQPDIAIGISTPSTQNLLNNMPHTPLVFAAVSDPESAGFLKDEVRKHVTGTIDFANIETQFAFYLALIPKIQTVGVIFNAGEANSVAFISKLKAFCTSKNLILREVSVARTSDVSSAVHQLISSHVDAILLPPDNTVVSALDTVVRLTHNAKIPLLSGDTELVQKGVMAAIGFSYYEVGLRTGKIAIQVIKGASPKDIPVEAPSSLQRIVNLKVMNAMGLKLPDDMRDHTTVIEE